MVIYKYNGYSIVAVTQSDGLVRMEAWEGLRTIKFALVKPDRCTITAHKLVRHIHKCYRRAAEARLAVQNTAAELRGELEAQKVIVDLLA